MKDGYRRQNGCWNCKHVVYFHDYEGPPGIYCDADKNRPQHPYKEICKDNMFSEIPEEAHRAWDEYDRLATVTEMGICDTYDMAFEYPKCQQDLVDGTWHYYDYRDAVIREPYPSEEHENPA